MHTYLLEKNEKLTVWEITDREPKSEQTSDGYAELNKCINVKETTDSDKKQKNKVKIF